MDGGEWCFGEVWIFYDFLVAPQVLRPQHWCFGGVFGLIQTIWGTIHEIFDS